MFAMFPGPLQWLFFDVPVDWNSVWIMVVALVLLCWYVAKINKPITKGRK